MTRTRIVESFGDENGDLGRLGQKGNRWFVERIQEAYSPQPGKTTRRYYKTEDEAKLEYSKLEDYYIS